jgi:hypothetical protein
MMVLIFLFCAILCWCAGQASAAADADADDHDDATAAAAPQASDELGSLLVLTSKHKLKSFAFNPAGGHKGSLGQLVLGLSNNSVEVRRLYECLLLLLLLLMLLLFLVWSLLFSSHSVKGLRSLLVLASIITYINIVIFCRWWMCARAVTSRPASWSCQVTAVMCAAWHSAAMTPNCSQAAMQVTFPYLSFYLS